MIKPFRYVDLFAGIGGLGAGFKALRGTCALASENDKFAARTFRANNPGVLIDVGDIRYLNPKYVPHHDVLLAGFPCPTFSTAGISKNRSLGRPTGLDCERGQLFFEAVRIIKHKRPHVVVMENVKNLVTHDKGRTFRIVRNALKALGYKVSWRVLDAAAWVPQHRERVFIVAVKAGKPIDLDGVDVPTESHWPTLSSVLHSENETAEPPFTTGTPARVNSKYTLNSPTWAFLQEHKQKSIERFNGFGYRLAQLDGQAATLTSRYCKDGSEILIPQPMRNPRMLTPRECARLMGFGDDFVIPVSDTQAYKQFGNAVCPLVSKAVATAVLKRVAFLPRYKSELESIKVHYKFRGEPLCHLAKRSYPQILRMDIRDVNCEMCARILADKAKVSNAFDGRYRRAVKKELRVKLAPYRKSPRIFWS